MPSPATRGEFAGQHALVTGGSQGIGRAIAELFLENGASVTIAALPGPALEETSETLSKRCGEGQFFDAIGIDLGETAAVRSFFSDLRSSRPALNILIANAGTGSLTPFLSLTDDEWARTLSVNLTSTFVCCQEAGRMMVDQPPGANRAMVLVSSIRGDTVRPERVAYSASKAGVNQLGRAVAYELAPHGIRVNVIAPGITRTTLALGNPENFEIASRSVPLGRAGEPTDIASAALYLCSSRAAFVTGVRMPVDGGESLW